MKRVHEKVLSYNGFLALTSTNLILIILTHKYSVFTLLVIILAVYSIYAAFILGWRVFRSINKLKDLQNFYINSYFYDLLQRKNIIRNVIKLLIGYLILARILLEVNLIIFREHVTYGNEVMSFLFLVVFFFIIILRLSHSKVSPVLMIFASTFFGLMILLISFMIILLIIKLLLTLSIGFLETGVTPSIAGEEIEIQDLIDNFVELGIGLIFVASDRTYFILNLLTSIFVQVIIIRITPPYFFKRSKNAFTFINYIFNALILLLLFISEDISSSINTFIEGFDVKGFEELLNQISSNTFKELLDKFINVTLMPYIIGSFIGLLLLGRKEEALQKEARNSYLTALYLHKNEDIKDVVHHLKKSVYCGGESYELLIRSKNDFIRYHNVLLTDEAVSTAPKQHVTKFLVDVVNRSRSAFHIIKNLFRLIPLKVSKIPVVLRQFADNYNLRGHVIILSVAFVGLAVFTLLDFISMNYEINMTFRILRLLFNSLSITFPILFLVATASYLYYRNRIHIAAFYFIVIVFLMMVLILDYFLIKILIDSFML